MSQFSSIFDLSAPTEVEFSLLLLNTGDLSESSSVGRSLAWSSFLATCLEPSTCDVDFACFLNTSIAAQINARVTNEDTIPVVAVMVSNQNVNRTQNTYRRTSQCIFWYISGWFRLYKGRSSDVAGTNRWAERTDW